MKREAHGWKAWGGGGDGGGAGGGVVEAVGGGAVVDEGLVVGRGSGARNGVGDEAGRHGE